MQTLLSYSALYIRALSPTRLRVLLRSVFTKIRHRYPFPETHNLPGLVLLLTINYCGFLNNVIGGKLSSGVGLCHGPLYPQGNGEAFSTQPFMNGWVLFGN